tara:strand:+ start:3369 stop:5867 length:2499 start_codon:yes stop_codon:yes gene_type:complete
MNGPFNFTIPSNFNRTVTDRQIRTGVTTSVVEEFSESRADRIVSTNIAQSMRARDITVTGENFKPNTPYFVFFDGINVNAHMTPSSSTYGMGGATSKGTNLRSDNLGAISAVFSIPNTDALSFSTGDKTLKITSDSTGNPSLSEGEAQYAANGQITIVQEEITSTRNGRIITDELSDSRDIDREVRQQVRWVDPLAQSFLVDRQGGIFVSSVELYFGAKDTALPVSVQIRHMENGMPTQKILPFGDKTLNPSSVNTSADASVATKFTFDSPIYLESGREYCAVVMTNSNVYTSWVSEMGQKDIKTNDFIDQQPYAGSLFKSQNNSTWTPDQMKDLKMTINRCKFTTGSTASVVFENGVLAAEKLQTNPIETVSGTKMFKVYHYSHGNYDDKLSNITISGVTGDRTGSVLRFTDDTIESGDGSDSTDNAQTLVATGGTGSGLTATLTTVGDDSTVIVITNPGQGYTVGDDVVFTKDSDTYTFDVAEVGDTLGGIPVAYINRTHIAGTGTAKATDGSARILNDIDTYLITIPNSVWAARSSNSGINYQGATESTTGGGSNVTATGNVYYDTLHTTIPSIELPNTSISTSFKGTTATQPLVLSSGRVVSFTKDSSSTTITLNDNNSLLSPKIVASGINETNEMGGAKSLEVTASLSTTRDNISPVLDVDSMGLIGVQNRINNIDSSSSLMYDTAGDFTGGDGNQLSTFVSSTEARGDKNAAVYCTKKVVLNNPANAIHVFFDGYKAHDSNGVASEIEVYYKIVGPDSNMPFNDVGWKEATIKNTVPADASDFKEHTYEIESLEDFNTFSVKIVLKSSNTSNVPFIENFRAIALST